MMRIWDSRSFKYMLSFVGADCIVSWAYCFCLYCIGWVFLLFGWWGLFYFIIGGAFSFFGWGQHNDTIIRLDEFYLSSHIVHVSIYIYLL